MAGWTTQAPGELPVRQQRFELSRRLPVLAMLIVMVSLAITLFVVVETAYAGIR